MYEIRGNILVTEEEASYDSASDPTLQPAFKKLALARVWCNIKEERRQVSELFSSD